MMPNETKQALLNTFDRFPDVTFIWKYEKEEHHIADGHPNVITDKWLPQTDLLAHPNLVAFLTHGGMNSITETLSRGKPVIVVPVFGDQMHNAVLAERSGFGIMLSVSDFQVEKKLSDAFEQIINDKRFSQKAERLSRMIAKRPNSATEQLIRHVEFAAEFGQIPNFDPYGRKMSFVSYFMLDIIIPFITILMLVLALLCYACYKLCRKLILGREPAGQFRNQLTNEQGSFLQFVKSLKNSLSSCKTITTWDRQHICSVPLNAYKILIFNPRFGKSHVRFMGNIADTLVEAGHEVVCN
ncbi:unnamed protein product [Gongylonema pulchrum]|uniref:UDP-glucuronosyltransferase n=1 Tax=Gongylonema pulchrum TaxID=637853 RepID=A0A183CYU6_9BILA|nr:unnamed protein product [Gongylonema pulchrum]